MKGADFNNQLSRPEKGHDRRIDFWSQDPYNWYVVLVLGTHSKNLLENSLNWKLSKLKVLRLKVAKTEGCQNWKLPKLKLPKLKVAKIESFQNCQNWKLLSC